MKTIKLSGWVAALVLVGTTIAMIGPRRATVEKKGIPAKGFALVELFTSEGCSSCPPADELVAKIEGESKDQPVYILSFHVDYWDRLGWKDSFSSPAYTARQKQYAGWMKLATIYTPEIVVNGRKEFVGSEEEALRGALKAALKKGSPATLTLDKQSGNAQQLTLQYHATGTPAATSLLLALVQKSAQSRVESGENGGRTLSHVQIVRQLQSVTLNGDASGTAAIEIPKGVNPAGCELVGFLQNPVNGEIIAAARVTAAL